MAAEPARYDRVELTEFLPPEHTDVAPPGRVDLVVTLRNVLNWTMRVGGEARTLATRGALNTNPSDRADHPQDGWSLPPVLRGGELDRDRCLAIGESDRVKLKLGKPDSRRLARRNRIRAFVRIRSS